MKRRLADIIIDARRASQRAREMQSVAQEHCVRAQDMRARCAAALARAAVRRRDKDRSAAPAAG